MLFGRKEQYWIDRSFKLFLINQHKTYRNQTPNRPLTDLWVSEVFVWRLLCVLLFFL